MFNWLKKHRRDQLVAEPFPAEWAEHFRRNVPYAAYLSADQVTRLKDNLRIFVAEKEWVGCGGLEMTDEMRVTIAALACLLVLEIHPTYHYDRVKSVLVHPGAYRWPDSRVRPGGMFGNPVLLGEAWHRSPIVVAWQAVLDGVQDPHDGHNVVFHEFAHHLDGIDGDVDGTPPLESREQYRTWDRVFERGFRQHVKAANTDAPTLLDYYGATNEAEFFAVATECFFECGPQLRDEHPELYDILRGFYRQDTAAWQSASVDEKPKRHSERASRAKTDGQTPRKAKPKSPAESAAIRRLLEKIRLQPGSASAHFSLGILYLNAREFQPAAEAFSAAIHLQPDDGEALTQRGIAFLGLDQPAAAKADLDTALAIDSADWEAHRTRAQAHIKLGNFQDALDDCAAALAGRYRDPATLHLKGLAFAGLGDYASAAAALTSAINGDPNQAEFYADRSQVFERLGNHDRAERDRIEAIRRDPELFGPPR